MDEEIDYIFENATESVYTYPLHSILVAYLDVLVCAVAFTLDILVVVAVFWSKQLRTRTNVILANRCSLDALVWFTEIVLNGILRVHKKALLTNDLSVCLDIHTMTVAQMGVVIFTLALVSDWIQVTELMSTKGLITCSYLVVLVHYTALLMQCVTMAEKDIVVAGVVALALYLWLLVTTAVKDVAVWRKKWDLSEDSRLRLNVARIFIYNWVVVRLFGFILHNQVIELWRFLWLYSHLVPVFTVVYIVRADVKLRMCLLNLVKCRGG